jgi:hypothetical protein
MRHDGMDKGESTADCHLIDYRQRRGISLFRKRRSHRIEEKETQTLNSSGFSQERRKVMGYAIVGAGIVSAYLWKKMQGPGYKWPWQK